MNWQQLRDTLHGILVKSGILSPSAVSGRKAETQLQDEPLSMLCSIQIYRAYGYHLQTLVKHVTYYCINDILNCCLLQSLID